MFYFVVFLVGMAIGGLCIYAITAEKRLRLAEQERRQSADAMRLTELKAQIEQSQQEVQGERAKLKNDQDNFERRIISYQELRDENAILKHDLLDLNLSTNKNRLTQNELDLKTKELGDRYLKENVKWISSSLSQNNYANCKQRLLYVIEQCREIGFDVSREKEAELLASLKEQYERAVRAAFEREEQARIKAQIREQQQLEKEVDRELNRLERERTAIQAALDQALAAAHEQHSAEVDQLKARLAEAEAKAERAKSQAQLTKAGYVYVISNIGSFGEGVYKVGMTRRLEPMDRVKELGDASVPFPFDVHMMISAQDAPSLENALHREFHQMRLNKINPRKEFFRVDLEAIRQIVVQNHGEVEYVADPEALEYRQSLTMSDEDEEYIESVYDELEDDGETTPPASSED